MKNQIVFTLVVFAVTLFLFDLVDCTTQPKPLDQRNAGFELIVKKDSLQKYVAFFDGSAQCAITGMDYKTQGFSFSCESLKPVDCAEKYDYFNQVKACLDKQKKWVAIMRLVEWQKLLNLHEGKAYQHVEVKSGERWVPVGSNAQIHSFLYKSPENFRLRV